MRMTYDKPSPVHGKRTVLVEFSEIDNDYLEMCMDSGFQTYTNLMMINSAHVKNIERELSTWPQVVDGRLSDGDRFWYKLPVVMDGYMAYPDYSTLDSNYNTNWIVGKLVEVDQPQPHSVPVIEGETNEIIGYMATQRDSEVTFSGSTVFNNDTGDLETSAFLQAMEYMSNVTNQSTQQND